MARTLDTRAFPLELLSIQHIYKLPERKQSLASGTSCANEKTDAPSFHRLVGRESEFAADAGVGRVAGEPFGVGGKLNFPAARNDAFNGGFQGRAGGGGVASQGKRRRNVGGEGGEFGSRDAAGGKHRGVFGFLRGGNNLPGVFE